MVKKGYFGKGIFSALNNIGQLTCNLHGVDYFEGTAIWSNNSRAIDTIFPHCSPLRKHNVVQKRIQAIKKLFFYSFRKLIDEFGDDLNRKRAERFLFDEHIEIFREFESDIGNIVKVADYRLYLRQKDTKNLTF